MLFIIDKLPGKLNTEPHQSVVEEDNTEYSQAAEHSQEQREA